MESRRVRCKHAPLCLWTGLLGPNGGILDNHLRTDCMQEMTHCSFAGHTHPILIRRDQMLHEQECPERRIPCDKCAEWLPFFRLKHHTAELCPEGFVTCPNACFENVNTDRSKTSLNTTSESKVTFMDNEIVKLNCVLVASTELRLTYKRKDLDVHLKKYCPRAMRKCPYLFCNWTGQDLNFHLIEKSLEHAASYTFQEGLVD